MKKLAVLATLLLTLAPSAFADHNFTVTLPDDIYQALQDNATAFNWPAQVTQYDPQTGLSKQVANDPATKDASIQQWIVQSALDNALENIKRQDNNNALQTQAPLTQAKIDALKASAANIKIQ